MKMLMLCWLFILGFLSRSQAEDLEEKCKIDVPVQALNFNAGRNFIHIFNSMDFPCDGLVSRWEYYAYRGGAFYAAVWRPVDGGWQLVGKNKIVSPGKGVQVADVPKEDRIKVKAGDVVGTHHNTVGDGGKGTIMYETSQKGPTTGLDTSRQGSVCRYALKDSDLPVEKTLADNSGNNKNKGLTMFASISGTVTRPTPEQATQEECDSGWKMKCNKCLKMMTNDAGDVVPDTYAESEKYCAAEGGKLAEATDSCREDYTALVYPKPDYEMLWYLPHSWIGKTEGSTSKMYLNADGEFRDDLDDSDPNHALPALCEKPPGQKQAVEDFGVIYIKDPAGNYLLSWDAAKEQCASLGLLLATPSQLETAWRKGLDVCSCSWLADGSVRYPITRGRTGCGDEAGIQSCPQNPADWQAQGWNAFCSTKKVPIVHLRGAAGDYQLSLEGARQQCASRGLMLATPGQLRAALAEGLDVCSCGWLADGSVQYPITKARTGCGSGAGLQHCPQNPGDWGAQGWNAFCSTKQMPVIHIKGAAGHYQLSLDGAKSQCASLGLMLATPRELQEALEQGMDVCSCGWLADGSVRYPIREARTGCGSGTGLQGCPTNPATWNNLGWNAFCSIKPMPVVLIKHPDGDYHLTWDAAKQQCASRGLTLATHAQLEEAWNQGLDVCSCGWMADGSVKYPIREAREGCGSGVGLKGCPQNPADWGMNRQGWNAFCSNKKVPVILTRDPSGDYQLTFDAAKQECAKQGLALATPGELEEAWKEGLDVCSCGWLADGSVQYPITKAREGCGTGVGLQSCPQNPSDWGHHLKGWNAYCSKKKKVPTATLR